MVISPSAVNTLPSTGLMIETVGGVASPLPPTSLVVTSNLARKNLTSLPDEEALDHEITVASSLGLTFKFGSTVITASYIPIVGAVPENGIPVTLPRTDPPVRLSSMPNLAFIPALLFRAFLSLIFTLVTTPAGQVEGQPYDTPKLPEAAVPELDLAYVPSLLSSNTSK